MRKEENITKAKVEERNDSPLKKNIIHPRTRVFPRWRRSLVVLETTVHLYYAREKNITASCRANGGCSPCLPKKEWVVIGGLGWIEEWLDLILEL